MFVLYHIKKKNASKNKKKIYRIYISVDFQLKFYLNA